MPSSVHLRIHGRRVRETVAGSWAQWLRGIMLWVPARIAQSHSSSCADLGFPRDEWTATGPAPCLWASPAQLIFAHLTHLSHISYKHIFCVCYWPGIFGLELFLWLVSCVCMQIHLSICVHVRVYVYVCVFMYVYFCVYMYMYVSLYMCIFVCECICMCFMQFVLALFMKMYTSFLNTKEAGSRHFFQFIVCVYNFFYCIETLIFIFWLFYNLFKY